MLGCKLYFGATDGMDLHRITKECVCGEFDKVYSADDDAEQFKNRHRIGTRS